MPNELLIKQDWHQHQQHCHAHWAGGRAGVQGLGGSQDEVGGRVEIEEDQGNDFCPAKPAPDPRGEPEKRNPTLGFAARQRGQIAPDGVFSEVKQSRLSHEQFEASLCLLFSRSSGGERRVSRLPSPAAATQGGGQKYSYHLEELWPGTDYSVRVRAVFRSRRGRRETEHVWPEVDNSFVVSAQNN